MVTGTKLYKKIIKELRKYDKAVKADREAYDRETNFEYRKTLNATGMAKSRSKAAEIESRMKDRSDELRRGISALIDSAINENYPKQTLKAADLDSGLVSILNAGFILDADKLNELYSQYGNFTCHQLIRDYAKQNNITLVVEEDRNSVLAQHDRDNFNTVMSTHTMNNNIIDADGAKAIFTGVFGIDKEQDDEIESEITKELKLEAWNKDNGYTQWSQE